MSHVKPTSTSAPADTTGATCSKAMSTDSQKSTKTRNFIKFSPRLRKSSRSGNENATKMTQDVGIQTTSCDFSLYLPNGLNNNEKQEFRSIFDMFDKNSDGKISCDELGVVLRTLGHRYSQTEVEEMIKNVDKNDNGYVEYDEFLLLMKRWASTASKAGSFGAGVVQDDEAREVFGIFDVDGNGFIDRHELRFIMSRLGENPGERDICEMFRLADLNGDGLIDYDEFTEMMSKMSFNCNAISPAAASSKASSRSVKRK